MVRITLILTVLFGGCGAPPATPVSPQPSPTDGRSDNSRADAAAPGDAGVGQAPLALVDGGAAVIRSTRSSFTFSNIAGPTGDQTAMIFLPTVQAVEGCGISRGGKLVVRLHTEKGKLVADPQPGSSLDPSARRCVLDALNRANVSESSNLGSGPMVRPTGFTSLLTIEW